IFLQMKERTREIEEQEAEHEIQRRWIDDGAANSMDQVLMAKHLLKPTLMDNTVGIAVNNKTQRQHRLTQRKPRHLKEMDFQIKKQWREDNMG
ncbi:hypothetical protein CCACVL1_14722, partial [Corchorus capsularis]